MHLSPSNRAILIHKRTAAALYGDDFAHDYQIVMPSFEGIARREQDLRTKPKPLDDRSRSQLRMDLRVFHDFVSLFPSDVVGRLHRPDSGDSDETLHRKLQENITLVGEWLRNEVQKALKKQDGLN